jgi:hypothetical protein
MCRQRNYIEWQMAPSVDGTVREVQWQIADAIVRHVAAQEGFVERGGSSADSLEKSQRRRDQRLAQRATHPTVAWALKKRAAFHKFRLAHGVDGNQDGFEIARATGLRRCRRAAAVNLREKFLFVPCRKRPLRRLSHGLVVAICRHKVGSAKNSWVVMRTRIRNKDHFQTVPLSNLVLPQD